MSSLHLSALLGTRLFEHTPPCVFMNSPLMLGHNELQYFCLYP